MNIRMPYQFVNLSDEWVKTHLTIAGLRLKHDLQGIPTLQLDEVKNKSIATTRTFDEMIENKADIRERVSTFAVKCAEKLRKQKPAAMPYKCSLQPIISGKTCSSTAILLQ